MNLLSTPFTGLSFRPKPERQRRRSGGTRFLPADEQSMSKAAKQRKNAAHGASRG